TLAESSPVGIFHTDASGYTTYVNKRWCQISGSSLEKAIGNGWFNAVHIDDKEKLINGWQQATKIEGISFSEYRFVRPDGTTAWVMGQATPERNQENQIVGYIGTITDITDRKTAEQVISASEEKYRTLVEQASDAIFLFDYDGNFLDLNTSAVKLSGYTREELLERTIHDLSIEDDIKMKPGCPLTTGLTLAKNVVYQ
ncbi:MAG: PAS domain-containing protein, partial [Ginsengibacter sp.]